MLYYAIIVHSTVNNVVLAMVVDTGSAVSVKRVHVYRSQFAKCQLQSSNKVFRSFTGESVPCKGMFRVHVQYKTNSILIAGCMLSQVANMYYLGETG